MSLDKEELLEHCKAILKSSRIRKKIVVLCEGKRIVDENEGRPSPQTYRKQEKWPDANFYKACISKSWSQCLPQFFNCGDRKDVIDTYFGLIDMHQKEVKDSLDKTDNDYLDPKKLFAIVDSDIQPQKIDRDDYRFFDTQEIYNDLYSKTVVDIENIKNHRIFVTGLIYKESYFLIPQLKEVYASLDAFYKGSRLNLEDIYTDMANDITDEADLCSNMEIVSSRISFCKGLDLKDCGSLQKSWKAEYKKDTTSKQELISSLLMIKKAKDYWNKILLEKSPADLYQELIDKHKDQIRLNIARFYSENTDNPNFHIPFILACLKQN